MQTTKLISQPTNGFIGPCPPHHLFILQWKWEEVPNLKCPQEALSPLQGLWEEGMLCHAEDSCTQQALTEGTKAQTATSLSLSFHGLSSHLLPIQLLPLMETVRWLGPDRVPI